MSLPRIMVVCGFGLGSSLVLKMTLDAVLLDAGIGAETFCSDEASAKGEKFDLVVTSRQFEHLLKDCQKPIVLIQNFLNKDEVKEKCLPVVLALIK